MAKLAKTLDKVLLGLVVVMFVGGHVAAYFVFKGFAGPPVDPVEVRWLDQNWEPDDRQWFYHASQGSSFEILTPYPWFVSFEQPKLPLFFLGEVPLLIEGDFLAGFGLLPDPVQEYRPDGMSIAWAIGDRYDALEIDRNNVDRLPVGFDRDSVWVDPVTDSVHDVVGLTCALCHTGQINYNGTGLRIDGAPALTDMNKFGLGFGIALAMTYYIPTRFSRFADRVLGEGYSDAERTALKTSLKAVLEDGEALDKLLKDRKILTTTKEGLRPPRRPRPNRQLRVRPGGVGRQLCRGRRARELPAYLGYAMARVGTVQRIDHAAHDPERRRGDGRGRGRELP